MYNKSAHERMWQQQFSRKDTHESFAARRERERGQVLRTTAATFRANIQL
jgi:hypothetical protein